jgi:hypothetical protein
MRDTRLGVTYSMCGGPAHGSIPPFARSQIRAVYFKVFLGGVPRCGRFEAAHITAVPKFCLRIAANDVVVQYLGHPVCLLFFRGLFLDGGN